MFILVPAWPKTDHIPRLTASLTGLTALAFLLTWPWQQTRQSAVTKNQYIEQAKTLAALLSTSGSDLKAEDRATLEAEQVRDPYPSAELVALFQRINKNPTYFSAESSYRWIQNYPLFETMTRSMTADPDVKTPFEMFGFQPSHGWFPGIITHLFLHSGWLHLLFNLLFLWTAGCVLEKRLAILLLPLYIFSGMAAAWTQITWGPPTSQVLVGASGAIAGLMGFALVAAPSARITLFYAYFSMSGRAGTFESPLWFCIPLWLLQQIFMLLMPLKGDLANVGYAAHVGGFVTGAMLGLLLLACQGRTAQET